MEPGTIVAGKYRVERVIGKGGMGIVVAARHLHLGTIAALKFLQDVGNESVVARFLREARACAQLRSEHICRVTDFGIEDGAPYIVMEMLEGSDLSRLLRSGPLDVPTAADYVAQACVGLAEAHARGIVHRDLKPGNLFLARRDDGSTIVKVLDFGVAKSPEGVDLNLTTTGAVVGSPGYMSPEQLRTSRNVDARSDVWALGIILYRLTSGRQPFKADAITDLAIMIATEPPPRLHEVPPAFEAIVMRCLEKDPDRRFPSVQELGAALAPFTLELRATAAFTATSFETTGTSGAPVTSGVAAGPAAVAADLPTTLGAASGVASSPAPRQASSRMLQLGVAAVVLAIAGGAWWTLGGGHGAAKRAAAPVRAPLDAAAAAAAAAPLPPLDAAALPQPPPADAGEPPEPPPADAAAPRPVPKKVPVQQPPPQLPPQQPPPPPKKPAGDLHFIQPK